VNTQQDGHFDT